MLVQLSLSWLQLRDATVAAEIGKSPSPLLSNSRRAKVQARGGRSGG
eukprot:CAMPEP_0117573890 /NCGR_PEP_ID=MMETSP0784-20121206/61242_1 /TAXON_ID=39447 /ORGANISM="" /LENGTH=46 /DNA_ID= /DNA_START= /DNA_END= /DNA_ORIENTATION=